MFFHYGFYILSIFITYHYLGKLLDGEILSRDEFIGWFGMSFGGLFWSGPLFWWCFTGSWIWFPWSKEINDIGKTND